MECIYPENDLPLLQFFLLVGPISCRRPIRRNQFCCQAIDWNSILIKASNIRFSGDSPFQNLEHGFRDPFRKTRFEKVQRGTTADVRLMSETWSISWSLSTNGRRISRWNSIAKSTCSGRDTTPQYKYWYVRKCFYGTLILLHDF